MERPFTDPPRVGQVKDICTRGPWRSKSGGELNVLFALSDLSLRENFFHYNDAELTRVPEDIRGLRAYTVTAVPQGGVGGQEFHRIRQEMIMGLEGETEWVFEDLYGEQVRFTLDQQKGVYLPSLILHTFRASKAESGFLVVANTLFNPDNPATHDTYSTSEFSQLKAALNK